MAQSFLMTERAAPLNGLRRKVLVTGAAGTIGAYFAEHSHLRYDLRLMVQGMDDRAEALKPYGEVVTGNVTDLEGMKALCADIDTVLHLAGDPDPSAVWSSLLEANILGTYNTYVAAKSAGCRRVIYASSIHAVSGYPADVQVKTNEPVNPGDMYGVTKCFGEAMGRYMAEQEGISVIALRIGAFQPRDVAQMASSIGMMDAFVSRRDLNQLIERCIDAEGLRFAILNGISDNRFKRLDISDARMLVGYMPQDDLTTMNEALKDLNLRDTVNAHNLSDEGQESGIREDV
jgi:NAD(P)-dependent dehydrogenase (short-subunit alcohol dehydrogenase family)